jgi:hypothetical protein
MTTTAEGGAIKCGACKETLLDDDDQPRTNALHHCKACRVALHSALACTLVWQPIADGDDSFCNRACLEAYNNKLLADHANALADEDDPPPAPDLLPVRRREDEPVLRAPFAAQQEREGGRVMGRDIPWDATFTDTRDPDDVRAAINACRGRGQGRGPGSRGGRPRKTLGFARQPATIHTPVAVGGINSFFSLAPAPTVTGFPAASPAASPADLQYTETAYRKNTT